MRLLERIGVAILLASPAALIVLALLLWYGRSTIAVVEMSLLMGLLAGLTWGIVRRPTLLQAALTADRQLQTAELLSSAWLCRRNQPDAGNLWLGQLFAEADTRCRELSPSALTVRRLGGRAWGAVVLAVALVMTLGVIGPMPTKSGPDSNGNRASAEALSSGGRDNRLAADIFVSSDNRPILWGAPDDTDASRFGQNSVARLTKKESQSGSSDNTDSPSHTDVSANEAGAGHGSARTHAPGTPESLSPVIAHAGAGSASTDQAAKPSAGAGAANGNTREGDAAAAGLTAGAGAASAIRPPPWNAGEWPADVQRAQSALGDGRIPSKYRDLVRGYFSTTD